MQGLLADISKKRDAWPSPLNEGKGEAESAPATKGGGKGPSVPGAGSAPKSLGDTTNVPSYTVEYLNPSVGSSGKGKGAAAVVEQIPENAHFIFATEQTKNFAHTVTIDDKGTQIVPLAPAIYRLCDYTLAKKEPVALSKAVLKLGVIRALAKSLKDFNALEEVNFDEDEGKPPHRFQEFLTSFGLKVTQRPVDVRDLDKFLQNVESLTPAIGEQQQEIKTRGACNFFPGLGEVFTPGSRIYHFPENLQGVAAGAVVVQSYYQEEVMKSSGKIKRTFILNTEFLVSIGDKLVFVAMSEPYSDFGESVTQLVKNFRHKPLGPGEVFDRLNERGKFYQKIAVGNTYLQYGPESFFPIPLGSNSGKALRPLSNGGRIMVDNSRGFAEGHFPTRGGDGASVSVREALKLAEQSKRSGAAFPCKPYEANSKLDQELIWTTWPMVVGFSFTARCWGKLAMCDGIGSCKPIVFRASAFDQLVLPEDKKELIRAVARYAGGGDEQIDVIANKGGASIFLLYGPPGCGKTLTAEAIAEMLGKPLYCVTAGDLGTTASDVEKTLSQVLQMCAEWNALVLLDEADIFLEARTSSELQRNAVVCVMLRLLEYHQGGLFLTTNRVGNIDPAVSSRITVMLGYEALDEAGRKKVWETLLGMTKMGKLEDKDLTSLASPTLNGRQIKNSILLAKALAQERKEDLSVKLLTRAIAAVAGERQAADDRLRTSASWGRNSVVDPGFVPH